MRKSHHIAAAVAALAIAGGSPAQEHDPSMHHHQPPGAMESAAMAPHAAPAVDGRQAVDFPPAMRAHTLTNMRDHLLALQELQLALAREEYDQAGEIAERRLGMTALIAHGAYERAQFMPQGMRDIGSTMHRNASRLAVAAKDAAATGDMKPVLEAMANVTAQCVACHAAYRVK